LKKRKVAAEDLFVLQSVTNPRLSPDGKAAVFVKTHIDEEQNKYVANLFHIDLDTYEVTQWTHGAQRVSAPAWSADGKHIAFLSDREEKNQLYVLSATGGEARKLTAFVNGVASFRWSPCGNQIWFAADVQKGKSFTDEPEKQEDTEKPEPVRVTKMKYKADGVGLLKQDVFRQIGVLDVETGTATPFTEGHHQHTLQAVSHDGKRLVIGVNQQENQDFDFRQPLVMVDVETKEETVVIDEGGAYGDARFSFDDRYIAFTGAGDAYKNATHDCVFVYDTADGTLLNLTEGLDAPVGDAVVADLQQGAAAPGVVWTKDNHLYYQLSTRGDVQLYFASLDGALFPATPQDEHVYDYDVSVDGEFALLCVSDSMNPSELVKHAITTGERETLTSFNRKYVEETILVAPGQIAFVGPDGWDVHGWLMKPADFVEGQRYPLIVEIHGGPHTMYGHSFFHELQLLAAQGYGVLYVNPRGSHGYSQAFVDAVRGDYGGGDYEDIMAGLYFLMNENEWNDPHPPGGTRGGLGGVF